jgi:hypothetical protein
VRVPLLKRLASATPSLESSRMCFASTTTGAPPSLQTGSFWRCNCSGFH